MVTLMNSHQKLFATDSEARERLGLKRRLTFGSVNRTAGRQFMVAADRKRRENAQGHLTRGLRGGWLSQIKAISRTEKFGGLFLFRFLHERHPRRHRTGRVPPALRASMLSLPVS